MHVGFGMPLDLDETFRRLIQIMIRGFQQGQDTFASRLLMK